MSEMVDDFNRKKRELRELYKRYKVGIVTADELTDDQCFLLKKYYGVKVDKE